MNRETALKKLQKLLGKDAAFRIAPDAPDADERAAASVAGVALRGAAAIAKTAMETRRAELLRDPEYLRLREAYYRVENERMEMAGRATRYRIIAGTVGGLFFSVRAQGDTWAEVFAKLQRGAHGEITRLSKRGTSDTGKR